MDFRVGVIYVCRIQPAVEWLQVYTQTVNAGIGLKWHVNQ